MNNETLRNWLLNLPCVTEGRVIIDVRGVHPTAIIGVKAQSIESRDDMYRFVSHNLDIWYGPRHVDTSL